MTTECIIYRLQILKHRQRLIYSIVFRYLEYQSDVTFGSLSESLRIYFEGISDSEPVIYSNWLSEAPFTARNPGRKTQIVSFLCDVLLQNKPPQIQEKVKIATTDDELSIKNISKDKWNHYHVLRDKKEIIDFGDSLHDEGVREGGLKSSLNGLNSVFSKKVPDFDDGGLSEMIDEDIDEDLVGVDPDLVYKFHQGLIETLEERVASACLQIKCWTLPLLRNQHNNGNLSQFEITENIEHILGITNPQGVKKYIAAAFPSAFDKTNLAMMTLKLQDWKVECVGDDVAWMQSNKKTGMLHAINPENGFFGVAPGTSESTNPVAMATIFKDTVFTNTASTSDDGVYWKGFHVPSNFEITSWTGEHWDINSKKPSAHPNYRFCSPAINCPNLVPAWEDPQGVPISAILFEGIWGMPEGVPLVYEAYDWTHGIYIGFSLCSEDKVLIWKMSRHVRLRTIIKKRFEETEALSWDLSLTDVMFASSEFNILLDAFNLDNENRKTEFSPWFTGCLVLYLPKSRGETLTDHIQSNWENSEAKIIFYHGKSYKQGPCQYLLGDIKRGENGAADQINEYIEKGYTAVWIKGNRYNSGTTKYNQALACAETFFHRLVSALQAKTKVRHKDRIKFESINQHFPQIQKDEKVLLTKSDLQISFGIGRSRMPLICGLKDCCENHNPLGHPFFWNLHIKESDIFPIITERDEKGVLKLKFDYSPKLWDEETHSNIDGANSHCACAYCVNVVTSSSLASTTQIRLEETSSSKPSNTKEFCPSDCLSKYQKRIQKSSTPTNMNKSKFSWEKYLSDNDACPAPPYFFKQNASPPENNFTVGMKLEAIDPRNPTSTCIGTVIGSIGPRLRLRLDGSDNSNDFWRMVDSNDIQCFGTAERKYEMLEPPSGFISDASLWPMFLHKTLNGAKMAPSSAFKSDPPTPVLNFFKVGMKLEAVDHENQQLICVATVGGVDGDLIKVTFDGWRGAYDYWTRFDSRDIFPTGWCASSGHPLQPPGPEGQLISNNSNPVIVNKSHLRSHQKNEAKPVVFAPPHSVSPLQQQNNNTSQQQIVSLSLKNRQNKRPLSNEPENNNNDNFTSTKKQVLHPSEWSIEDVLSHITAVDKSMIAHSDVFRKHEIDGKAMLLLNSDVMMKYMGLKLGPALKIINIIGRLINKSPANPSVVTTAPDDLITPFSSPKSTSTSVADYKSKYVYGDDEECSEVGSGFSHSTSVHEPDTRYIRVQDLDEQTDSLIESGQFDVGNIQEKRVDINTRCEEAEEDDESVTDSSEASVEASSSYNNLMSLRPRPRKNYRFESEDEEEEEEYSPSDRNSKPVHKILSKKRKITTLAHSNESEEIPIAPVGGENDEDEDDEQDEKEEEKPENLLKKKFTIPKDCPVHTNWLTLNFEYNAGQRLPKSFIYSQFVRFSIINGRKIMNDSEFGKIKKKVFPGLETKKYGGAFVGEYFDCGLYLKSDSQLHIPLKEHQEKIEATKKKIFKARHDLKRKNKIQKLNNSHR